MVKKAKLVAAVKKVLKVYNRLVTEVTKVVMVIKVLKVYNLEVNKVIKAGRLAAACEDAMYEGRGRGPSQGAPPSPFPPYDPWR